jgi:hypothetical protein
MLGCSDQKKFKIINYKGTVYDSTGNPVANCNVVLSGKQPYNGKEYFEVANDYTDASGQFNLSGYAARSKIYSIYAGVYKSTKAIRIKDVKEKELKSIKCTVLVLQ